MRRLLLLVPAFGLFSISGFGQVIFQGKPNFPIAPQVPRQYSLRPQPANGVAIPGLQAALPYGTWQVILKKDSVPAASGFTLRPQTQTMAKPGQCSVPLLQVPIPEHFDDRSVLTAHGNVDAKMAIEPPPDCPLPTAYAGAPPAPKN